MTDASIAEFVARHDFGNRPAAGTAYFTLIREFRAAGGAHTIAVREATDNFLDALGYPELKHGTAREWVDKCLAGPSDPVRFQFYRRDTRLTLDPSSREQLHSEVIDLLSIENWP